MKYFASILGILVFIVPISLNLTASEMQGQERTTLTLPQAISIALQRNYDIVSSESNIQVEKAQTRNAYGNFLPSLGISGTTSQSSRTGPLIIEGEPIGPTITRTTTSYSTGAGGSITLFDGFNNFGTLNRSRHNLSAAEYGLENTQRNVINRVYTLYYNIFRSKKVLEVRQEDLRRSQAQLERIVESNRVGIVPIIDVRRQEVVVGTSELQLIQAELNLQNAKADLTFYLGLNPLVEYEFDPAGVPMEIEQADVERYLIQYRNVDELTQRSLQHRPDLDAARHRVYAAESGITIARSSFWPSISLRGSYGLSATEFSQLDRNQNRGYELSISIPIFTRFTRSSSIEQAKVGLRNAENQLRQLENNVLLDLRKAISDLEAAAKRIEVTEKNIIAAREEQRFAEERYNLGAGTLLDLIVANANLSNALNDNIDAIFTFYVALNQVRLITGEELY